MSSWHTSFAPPERGESSVGFSSNMAESASSILSQKYINKHQRLSLLLDKLNVQITHNNNYQFASGLMLNSNCNESDATEEEPLDLSIKAKTPPATYVPYRFTCDLCGQSYPFHKNLVNHIVLHHRDIAQEVPMASRSIKVEPPTTTNEPPNRDKVQEANRNYVTTEAGTPMTITEQPKFKCVVCGQDFIFHNSFAKHIALCNKDRTQDTNSDYLSTEAETPKVTNVPPKFKCDICGQNFLFYNSLAKHIVLYHKEISKEGNTVYLYRSAEATTVLLKYSCHVCGQVFPVHDRLAKHVASCHRDKPSEVTRAFKCEVCQRRFARSDMLTRHARLHSGVKPYSCYSCDQVFSRSDHLVTHQRTHTGEKPYRCPICPYAACRRDMITRHMRTHKKQTELAEI